MHDGFEEPPRTIGIEESFREHLPVLLNEINDRCAMLQRRALCQLIGREQVFECVIEARYWHEWLVPTVAVRTYSAVRALRHNILA